MFVIPVFCKLICIIYVAFMTKYRPFEQHILKRRIKVKHNKYHVKDGRVKICALEGREDDFNN